MARIVILGAGESGAGAAVLAQKKDLTHLYQTCPHQGQVQSNVERKRYSMGRR